MEPPGKLAEAQLNCSAPLQIPTLAAVVLRRSGDRVDLSI